MHSWAHGKNLIMLLNDCNCEKSCAKNRLSGSKSSVINIYCFDSFWCKSSALYFCCFEPSLSCEVLVDLICKISQKRRLKTQFKAELEMQWKLNYRWASLLQLFGWIVFKQYFCIVKKGEIKTSTHSQLKSASSRKISIFLYF